MNKEIDISNVQLNTKNLVLRPFREEDLLDFNEYAKVPGVGEMAGWNHHESLDESKEILDMFIKEKKVFAIVKDNKVIGSVGIERYNEKLLFEFDNLYGREIGYVLSKDYWGMGIMREAVEAVIDYLFNVINLDFISCGYFEFNNQSKRVQEKLGFKYLQTVEYEARNGITYKTVMNIISKEDYRKA